MKQIVGILFITLLPGLALGQLGPVIPPILTLLLLDNQFNVRMTGKLNDTGVIQAGSSTSTTYPTCVLLFGEPSQDCSEGRDVTHHNNLDGHAGFSFVKINHKGEELVRNATSWQCVGDRVTGLMWEKKTTDGGLHQKENRFTWLAAFAGPGNNGAANDTCAGFHSGWSATYCNTFAYIHRTNSERLCGYDDWRLPTVDELHGIVSYAAVSPAIDNHYFPNTPLGPAWTSIHSSAQTGNPRTGARVINFDAVVAIIIAIALPCMSA